VGVLQFNVTTLLSRERGELAVASGGGISEELSFFAKLEGHAYISGVPGMLDFFTR